MKPWELLRKTDPEIYQLIEEELYRQNDGIELIASENFACEDVVASAGNPLTNKYAEGRPGKRYYGGCEVVDKVESIAINRVCNLFGSKFANVQPHSGAQANAAVFLALLKPGDRILGMDLSHGGHLTHGSKVNFSGILYESSFYRLGDDERLNYENLRQQAIKYKPRLIIAGASAYPRKIDFKIFRDVADEVGAYLVVDMAHIAGLVAADLHPSPIPYAHVITSTTHKTLRGPRGGIILWNDESLTTDLNKAVFPGTQGGPLEHIIASKALCFKKASDPEFKNYQTRVISNAQVLASELQSRDLRLVSGGTDNHLLLIDLSGSDITGKDFEEALGKVNITVNKNTVPKESRSPFITSGIRLGTPAVTSRGFGSEEMKKTAYLICEVYKNIKNEIVLKNLASEVNELARKFPLYPNWLNHSY